MLCDPGDYSRVYHYEIRDPKSGRIRELRDCSEFDEQGFPRAIMTVRYKADGTTLASDKIVVEKVVLNPDIPQDVFTFGAPVGYGIIDRRFDKPLVISPHLRDPEPDLHAALEKVSPIGNTAVDSDVAVTNSRQRTASNETPDKGAQPLAGPASDSVLGPWLVGLLLVGLAGIITLIVIGKRKDRVKAGR